jgi:hypothetical protein
MMAWLQYYGPFIGWLLVVAWLFYVDRDYAGWWGD